MPARWGWIKLSELQESTKALALTPYSRVGGVEEGTVARVGYTDAVALLCSDRLLAGLDLQTLAKCPFF